MSSGQGIILEFRHVGAYVKVSAMDPVTLTEISIVGDPLAGEAALRRAAVRRLHYVLERRRDEPD